MANPEHLKRLTDSIAENNFLRAWREWRAEAYPNLNSKLVPRSSFESHPEFAKRVADSIAEDNGLFALNEWIHTFPLRTMAKFIQQLDASSPYFDLRHVILIVALPVE